MNSIIIRTAKLSDTQEILDIYAPYVNNTTVTFEYEVPQLLEFENRISTTLEKYPYLVALIDEKIVGYAYASSFKGRAAYDWSCEISIYINEAFHHQGIGKCLYQQLELLLSKQNIRNICACIAYPNPFSVYFHSYFGFQQVAHFHKSGYKFEQWHDMIWMEKFIRQHNAHPEAFIPFPNLTTI